MAGLYRPRANTNRACERNSQQHITNPYRSIYVWLLAHALHLLASCHACRACPKAVSCWLAMHAAVAKAKFQKKRCKEKQPPPPPATTRVQLFGERVQCSSSQHAALQTEMRALRESRSKWTAIAWKHAVARLVAKGKGWGASSHGGARKRPASAVVEHHGSGKGASAVGDDVSAVGEQSGTAQGALAKEQGQEVSAVGEPSVTVQGEHGSQADEQSGVGGELVAILPHPRAPKSLCSYEVIERISGGSFGDVYKVKNSVSGKLFAVKVMVKTSKTAKRSEAQSRELDVMRAISGKHPNVIQLIGWRETAFDFQLFMPLCETNLRKYIQCGPTSIKHCRTMSSHVCSAVAYLHEHQIMHRDIKPPNILVRRQPLAAVLADFGCTKVCGLPGPPMTPKMCTLWYRAPEILANQETYALSSDVWSVGITLVEIELGEAPFQHSSELGMLKHIMSTCGGKLANGNTLVEQHTSSRCSHPWGKTYGGSFEELIGAMLVVDPAQRKTAEACMKFSFIHVVTSSRWQGT